MLPISLSLGRTGASDSFQNCVLKWGMSDSGWLEPFVVHCRYGVLVPLRGPNDEYQYGSLTEATPRALAKPGSIKNSNQISGKPSVLFLWSS